MGMFPYECGVCGGGYKICGAKHTKRIYSDYGCGDKLHSSDCDGGQFCWDEQCMIKLSNGKFTHGYYSGYGIVKVFSTPKDEQKARDIHKEIKRVDKMNKMKRKLQRKMDKSQKTSKKIPEEEIQANFDTEDIEKLFTPVDYVPKEFVEHLDSWYDDKQEEMIKEGKVVVVDEIYCKDCFNKHPNAIKEGKLKESLGDRYHKNE